VEELLTQAAESVALNDLGGAAQAYAQILSINPEHPKAIGGLARCYLTNGDAERAQEVLDMAPASAANDPDIAAVRAALALAAKATGETAGLQQKLAADPLDHQSRFDLAQALAGQGDLAAAADHLLQIIEKDRAWNDEAARKELLTVFEAAGPISDVAKQGRRRLSAILFS
jgi:putative thioredoxin